MSKQYVDIESIKDIFRIIKREYLQKTQAEKIIGTKQDVLIDNYNIKTINGQSILGSGNLDIPIEDLKAREDLNKIEISLQKLEAIDLRLQEKIEINERSIEDLQYELKNIENDIVSLEEALTENLNLNSKNIDNILANLTVLEQIVNTNLNNLKTLDNKVDKLSTETNAAFNDISNELVDIKHDISILKSSSSDYDDNKSKLSLLEKGIEYINSDIAEVKEDIQNLQESIESDIDRLQENADKDHERIVSLTETKLSESEFNYAKNELIAIIESNKNLSDNAINNLNEKINTNFNLNSSELEKIKSDIDTLDKDIEDTNIDILSIKENIKTLSSDIQYNETNISNNLNSILKVQSDLSSINSKIDSVENDLKTKQDTLNIDTAVSTASTNPVQNKVITAYVDTKTADSRIKDLAVQATQLNFNNLNNEISNLKARDIVLNTDIISTRDLISNLEDEVETEVSTLSGDIENLDKELTTLNNKVDTKLDSSDFKTINGETIVGTGNISINAHIDVDTSISTSSTNPVQNKVIAEYITGNYYNKEVVDTKIAAAVTQGTVDLSNYATKQDIETTKTYVDTKVADYATKDYSDNTYATKTTLTNNYYTKNQVDQAIADAATGGEINLDNYVDLNSPQQITGGKTFTGNVNIAGQLYDSSNSKGLNGQVLTSTGSSVKWVDLPTSDNVYTQAQADLKFATKEELSNGINEASTTIMEEVTSITDGLESRIENLENNPNPFPPSGDDSSSGVIVMGGSQLENISELTPAQLIYCNSSSDSFTNGNLYYTTDSEIIKLNGTSISLDPAIKSFSANITGLESNLLELGQSFTINSVTHSFKKPTSINNVQLVLNNSTVLKDEITPSGTTATTELNEQLEAQTSNKLTLKATYSKGTLTQDLNYSGVARLYYGTTSTVGIAEEMTEPLIETEFIQQTGTMFKSSLCKTLPSSLSFTLSAVTAYYAWIIVPSNLSIINNIVDQTTGFSIPFIKQGSTITCQNKYGKNVTYNCYRTVNKITGNPVMKLN